MIRSRFFTILFTIFSLLIIYSCEEVADYYLGFNQQPEIIENTFEPGLNLFGILRPDSKQGFNKSFVFVQQLWPALQYLAHALKAEP